MENSSTNAVTDPDVVIQNYLTGLQGDITNLVSRLTQQHLDRIQQLEHELATSKAVNDYFQDKIESLKSEKDSLNRELTSNREGSSVDSKATGETEHRVVCLIDGDESIFSLSQLEKGTAGGRFVAATLAQSIQKYMNPLTQYTLRVWVFYNKSGLFDLLANKGRSDICRAIEDFALGFSQASDRFLMADIGTGRYAVPSKLKAYLEDEIKCSQTYGVFLAGGSNNGCMETLKSLTSTGFREKLILLHGNSPLVTTLNDLKLPTIRIPDIFLTGSPAIANGSPPNLPPPIYPPGLYRKSAAEPPLNGYHIKNVPFAGFESTYHGGIIGEVSRQSSPTSPARIKRIDPNKTMSKQNPPPCNMFYLANRCKYGDSCNFCHDYVMSLEQINNLRESVKRTPCATVNKGDVCPFDEGCCYGHKCPFGQECDFLKHGKCKFVGGKFIALRSTTLLLTCDDASIRSWYACGLTTLD